MPKKWPRYTFAVLTFILFGIGFPPTPPALAQGPTPEVDAGESTDLTAEPLSEDELEVLVARIALYPDDLVAAILSASLFPIQIVEAERFLDRYAKDKSLKPKESWDGSVISLLNYPEIVRMMSDDLEWTQALGDSLTFQQKDVLVAIQQLRDEAVTKGIIKSDEKITVTQDNDNVVIQSASHEQIYIPRYAPEMLYEPDYAPAPVTYYEDPYPSYYFPTAPFFAAAVTGAVWASAVDWNNWGVWGGRWRGDVDIDCNRCLNNIDINRKVSWNDIDWRNVDRDKIKIDRDQLAKFDRGSIRDHIKAEPGNALREKAAGLHRDRPGSLPNRAAHAGDIRKNAIQGLHGSGALDARPGVARPDRPRAAVDHSPPRRPAASRPSGSRPVASRPDVKPRDHVSRPSGPPKIGAKVDRRPADPSGLGNVRSGRVSQVHSHRGAAAMSGVHRGGHAGMPHRGGGGGRRR